MKYHSRFVVQYSSYTKNRIHLIICGRLVIVKLPGYFFYIAPFLVFVIYNLSESIYFFCYVCKLKCEYRTYIFFVVTKPKTVSLLRNKEIDRTIIINKYLHNNNLYQYISIYLTFNINKKNLG